MNTELCVLLFDEAKEKPEMTDLLNSDYVLSWLKILDKMALQNSKCTLGPRFFNYPCSEAIGHTRQKGKENHILG